MLRVEKSIYFLSPSSLNQAEKMPNTFYLQRLITSPIKVHEQSFRAGVGSAFDVFIKQHLFATGKFNDREERIRDLDKSVEIDDKTVWEQGREIFREYIEYSHFKEYNFTDIELWVKKTIGEVPMYGKLDATVDDKPFDWKVSKTSPKKGYTVMYDKNGINKVGAWEKDMSKINESWAIQMCTYGWLTGLSDPLRPVEFDIKMDMITLATDKMRVATYHSFITTDFQIQTYDRYLRIWKSIQDGSFVERLASKYDINAVYLQAKEETWF